MVEQQRAESFDLLNPSQRGRALSLDWAGVRLELTNAVSSRVVLPKRFWTGTVRKYHRTCRETLVCRYQHLSFGGRPAEAHSSLKKARMRVRARAPFGSWLKFLQKVRVIQNFPQNTPENGSLGTTPTASK